MTSLSVNSIEAEVRTMDNRIDELLAKCPPLTLEQIEQAARLFCLSGSAVDASTAA